MIDHDAVVKHAHAIANNRLVVFETLGDKTTVAEDCSTASPAGLPQETHDGVVGPVDQGAARLQAEQPT